MEIFTIDENGNDANIFGNGYGLLEISLAGDGRRLCRETVFAGGSFAAGWKRKGRPVPPFVLIFRRLQIPTWNNRSSFCVFHRTYGHSGCFPV